MRRAKRLFLTLGLAFFASTGFAFAKDSVTIGMTLEPPGLDPTAARRRRSAKSSTTTSSRA